MENFTIYNGGMDFCNFCIKKKGEYKYMNIVKLKVQVATYIDTQQKFLR